MNLLNLIEEASRAKGSALELARCMRKAPARISEWKKGRAKPDAGEVAYMAKAAGLPVLITVAMIEAELHPETRELWEMALGEIEARPGFDLSPVRYRAITDNLAKLVSFWFGASPRLGCA